MPTINAIDETLALDPDLCSLIESAPMMPMHGGNIDPPTATALEVWLKANPQIEPTCAAGLWLLAGDLERAHQICQNIDTPEGSFWHSIMHRREGDYSNAHYWIKQVDWHPVFRQLLNRHLDYHGPTDFINWIQRAVTTGGGFPVVIEQVQWLEWQMLFQHCWKVAGTAE